MKLYGVALKGEIPFENLAMAIWASSEGEAESYWRRSQDGDDENDAEIETWTCEVEAEPEQPGVHEEQRLAVLREAGWREEDDRECECCGEWSGDVSSEFGLCPKCYAEEIGE